MNLSMTNKSKKKKTYKQMKTKKARNVTNGFYV
jgi:hypothetical protein